MGCEIFFFHGCRLHARHNFASAVHGSALISICSADRYFFVDLLESRAFRLLYGLMALSRSVYREWLRIFFRLNLLEISYGTQHAHIDYIWNI